MATEFQSIALALTVGLFDAAPGVGFLDQFNQRLAAGDSRLALAKDLVRSEVFQEIYPDTMGDRDFSIKFINNLVGSSASDSSRSWAVQWLEEQLDSGVDRAEAIVTALDELQGVSFENPYWGNAAQLFANKISAAAIHSILAGSPSGSVSELQTPLQGITADIIPPTGEKILSVTFENRNVGEYSRSDYEEDLAGPGAIDHFRNGSSLSHEIVSYGGDQMLRVVLPQGEVQQGLQSYISLGTDYESLALSYEILFEDGFDWAAGGKLPGLSGIVGTTNATGKREPDEYEGFSARSMYRTDGAAEQYRYDESASEQKDFYKLGDATYQFKSNTLYQIEQHIIMNTPGVHNGVILTWINGQLVGGASDYLLRSSYDGGINKLLVDIWAGGGGQQFEPANDSYVLIDDINVMTLPEYDSYLNTASDFVLTSQVSSISEENQKKLSIISVDNVLANSTTSGELPQDEMVIQGNEITIIGSTSEFLDVAVW